MKKIASLALASLVLIVMFGCGSSPSTSSPPPVTTTSNSGGTFQSLANQGQSVFSGKCASCHGVSGQGTSTGPALWGSNHTPGQYNGATLFASNGQAMLGFISSSMPLTSPGSLSHADAVNVLCYLLVQDNQVTPSAIFDESQLSGISLK